MNGVTRQAGLSAAGRVRTAREFARAGSLFGGAAAGLLLAAGLPADTARGANVYVVPTNAAAVAPYDTWAKAATSIQTAVDYAGAHLKTHNTVVVSNGMYRVKNQITITNGVTVRSFEGGLRGASNTVVELSSSDHSKPRVFFINHADAVLEGFTICKGGGGVRLISGLLRDCVVRNNNGGPGDGVYMAGGTISNCVIRENHHGGRGAGVGVWARGNSRILDCEIRNNTSGDVGGLNGGGVCADAPSVLIRNCLIVGNRAKSQGGGVYGGTVESCTIVGNRTGVGEGRGPGGGTCNSIVINSVVYGNYSNAVGSVTDNWSNCRFEYSCTWPKPGAGEGNIDADPLFVNPAAGNYRLQYEPVKSPCMDTGRNQEWMATATDLDGKGRIFRDRADGGAYEYWPDKPIIRNAGVTNLTGKSAIVRGNITWAGIAADTVFVYHGPSDGGTNRQAWANEVRLSGLRRAGLHEATIAHSASNLTWCYRFCATNLYGEAWADSSSGLTMGAVEVKATRRESTEEKPAEFVISRPATAANGSLDVYFTLGGTGVNGTDYEKLDSPVVIPAGATEVRMPVNPVFSLDARQPKSVELTITPGGYSIGAKKSAQILTRPQ